MCFSIGQLALDALYTLDALSLMVLMPLTADKATFAFSALVKILRLLSLIVKPFFMTGYSLNYCREFGIHYSSCTASTTALEKG